MPSHPGSFPSALNTWSKVWPWILIWAYLIWNFAPIFGQQISILDRPPYIKLFGPSCSELSPYGWIAGGGGGGLIGPPTFFVTDGQKRDYLSRASQRARGATKNWLILAFLSVHSHISKATRARPNFTKFSMHVIVAVAWSFSGGISMGLSYALPVLWKTIGPIYARHVYL